MTAHSTALPGSEGEHRAQAAFGTTRRALAFYNHQMLTYLTPLMSQFIAGQEMVFIATADARGHADSSVRFGPPGFVLVLDEHTLIYPEYRGNGVMASVGNLGENPHIGLLFIDFVHDTIGLHVNGQAKIIEKESLLDYFVNSDTSTLANGMLFEQLHLTPAMIEHLIELTLTTGGRRPERWIAVVVEEAYIHCSKHIPLLQKLEKPIHWGTDDHQFKGGDAFAAKSGARPWLAELAEPDPLLET